MTSALLNRTVVVAKTNKSGGAHAQGDVCVEDGSNANAVVNNTSGAYVNGLIWVCIEPAGVASNAVGLYACGGFVPKINLSGSASLGDFVKTHTVAKQGVRHAAPMVAGDFAQVLGTGTTPAAVLLLATNQGGAGSLLSANNLSDLASAVTARANLGIEGAKVDVASASTCNIGAATSQNVRITGTTTITAFDTVADGILRRGWFAGALTLTHNATSLILPGGANITTAAGDSFTALSLGSGNWRILEYQKADGTAVVSAGGGLSYFGITTMVAVPSGGWTWDNQSTSTITSSGGVEALAAVTGGSERRIRYMTPANSHFRMTGLISHFGPAGGGACFGFRDSGGKLVHMDLYNNGTLYIMKWNSTTSFSSTPTNIAFQPSGFNPIWLRVDYDGTNIIFYYSIDSQVFHQLHTETLTTFLASGTPKFEWGANVIAGAAKVSLLSLTETALP